MLDKILVSADSQYKTKNDNAIFKGYSAAQLDQQFDIDKDGYNSEELTNLLSFFGIEDPTITREKNTGSYSVGYNGKTINISDTTEDNEDTISGIDIISAFESFLYDDDSGGNQGNNGGGDSQADEGEANRQPDSYLSFAEINSVFGNPVNSFDDTKAQLKDNAEVVIDDPGMIKDILLELGAPLPIAGEIAGILFTAGLTKGDLLTLIESITSGGTPNWISIIGEDGIFNPDGLMDMFGSDATEVLRTKIEAASYIYNSDKEKVSEEVPEAEESQGPADIKSAFEALGADPKTETAKNLADLLLQEGITAEQIIGLLGSFRLDDGNINFEALLATLQAIQEDEESPFKDENGNIDAEKLIDAINDLDKPIDDYFNGESSIEEASQILLDDASQTLLDDTNEVTTQGSDAGKVGSRQGGSSAKS